MKTMICLSTGVMCSKISDQLLDQNLAFDTKEVFQFQQDLDAINRLFIRNIITDSQNKSLKDKWFKKVQKHVQSKNTQSNGK